MDDLKELTRRLNESEATILRMNQERAALFEEVQAYAALAKLAFVRFSSLLLLLSQPKAYRLQTRFFGRTAITADASAVISGYEQMTDPGVMKLRPYWQYDAVNDAHTRPSHLAMDGRVFPADSEVWNTWFPPNGFRCRCTVKTLSKRQVEARGLKVEQTAPEGLMPDPHFSTNPAKVRFEPDLKDYPAPLVKAYQNREKENPGK